MKKSKLILMVIFILFLSIVLFSNNYTVTPNTAKNIAKNWINLQMHSLESDYGIQGLRWKIISMREIREGDKVLAYNFSLYPAGHILVSAYKFLPTVKLYSYTSPLENSNFIPLIKKIYSKEVKVMSKFSDEKIEKIAKKNLQAWKNIENIKLMSEKPLTVTIKGPIVSTRWNQNNPYNKYSPKVNGQSTYAGCVATSFSQIMKYWNYPPKGQGSHSYITDTHKLSVSTNFNHDYYWDKMPNSITASSSSSQIDAIAQLIYDVGVAVEMDFTPSGSGAYPSLMVKNMPKFFKYSSNIKYDQYSWYNSLHSWFLAIKKEIDLERPVNLAIYSDDAGHSVVVDGYKIDGSNEYFHINMGWSGSYDGYYKPNQISEFNKIEWENAVVNIYPSELPNAPKPPVNIKVQRTTKNFLLYDSYYDSITWGASPTGDSNLTEYRVYEKKATVNEFNEKDWQEKLIATVKIGKAKYLLVPRGVVSEEVGYTVTAVGKNGVESRKPDYIFAK